MSLLELKNVHTYYGHIHALKGISLTVEEGEIVTLIGSNGAGKTTTLRTISGLVKPRQGEVLFQGRPIHRLPAHEIVALGVGHVPEGRRIFPRLTVEENLEIGAYLENDRKVIQERKEQVYQLFPRLYERRQQKGGTLSGGEQQMLAIGRALMGFPRILLVDEPSLGLSPRLAEEVLLALKEVARGGVGVLLVEQNVALSLEVAERGYVLEHGRVVLEGPAQALAQDPRVREAYLSL